MSTDEKEVHIVVTGFGPFGGVTNNPTTVLAQGLKDYLDQRSVPLPSQSVKTLVLETSVEGVCREIDRIHQETTTSDSITIILLHLGVDYQGTKFHLESCAYNDATFRIPDERGFQPAGDAVVKDYQIGLPLRTLVDMASLVERLNPLVRSNKTLCESVQVSTDPGRFVCNYTYCYSLDKFQCHQAAVSSSNVRCLFLHVPPFQVIPEQEQFWFVSQLLLALYQQATSTTAVN